LPLKQWGGTDCTNPLCLYLFDFVPLITPRENSYHLSVASSLLQFPRFKGSDCRYTWWPTRKKAGLCVRDRHQLCAVE